VLEQRLETITVNRIQTGLQQVANIHLGSTQPIVQNGAEGGGAVWAAVGLRNQNVNVLNLFHRELAHLPQHLGGTEFGSKKLWKIELDAEVVGHAPLFLGDPGKSALYVGVGISSGLGSATLVILSLNNYKCWVAGMP